MLTAIAVKCRVCEGATSVAPRRRATAVVRDVREIAAAKVGEMNLFRDRGDRESG